MAIKRRDNLRKPPNLKKKTGGIIRRYIPGAERTFKDNVEEYIFNLPQEPLLYIDLIKNWILPYGQSSFSLFGRRLRLTPQYRSCSPTHIEITGLLVEVFTSRPTPMKQIITGPRGTWHAKTKYYIKVQT